jgi:hypothetical protein
VDAGRGGGRVTDLKAVGRVVFCFVVFFFYGGEGILHVNRVMGCDEPIQGETN